ncbi:MAG: ankyrin repeat domain-containing protein [Polyangiales bacterium]
MSIWKRVKSALFGGEDAPSTPATREGEHVGFSAPRPDLAGQPPAWIDAAESPFGVRALDVRPITLGTLSASKDPVMASNAVSYGGETGRSFAAQRPQSARVAAITLRYRAPEGVHDGALFIPTEMEDKWALFVVEAELLLVRSWRREVLLRAPMTLEGDEVVIGPPRGFVCREDEGDAYTRRALDFILRTHALELPWPAPLLPDGGDDPRARALECMSMFGRSAHYASHDEPAAEPPERPLRAMTPLHLAAMRGDLAGVDAALAAGTPARLKDRFGRGALHYADRSPAVLARLLEAGASLDDPADDGTTVLMYATQARRGDSVRALLERGAEAGLADARGFTALHRAAEMGEVEVAKALLAHGANPDAIAEGDHTPRSLAAMRGQTAITALFTTN